MNTRLFNYILLGAVLIGSAGKLQYTLLQESGSPQMDQPDMPNGLPPLPAFTTLALGGFRGFIADLLWLRAERMQREGRYFEIVQLANWITKLEPQFEEVWIYHAWNMSYNISILFSNPQDRWRWIENGIRLLRDEALRINPSSARICRELGWIFQHKIGSDDDIAHLYYKQPWAALMQRAVADPEKLKALRLDPHIMRQLDETYGAFDWRLPQAHAVYWAWQSRKYARTDFEKTAAERMINQSILSACETGLLDDANGAFILQPNTNLVPYAKILLEQIKDKETNSS